MRAAWIGIAAALLLCFAAPARAESGTFDLTTETDILIGGSAGTPSWVKRAGDVNGDGAQDLLVSSWSRVYVLFGPLSPGSSDLDTLAERGFYIEGTGYELYGSRTAAVGDMNGDGLDDIIVGAPAHHRGGTTQAGAAYVVFGKASTEPVLVDSLGSQGFLIEGPDYGNNTYGPALGSVDGAGDVNGDGRPDVIVGSQQDSRHNYVVFGKADTGTVDVTALSAGGFAIRHENSAIWLGYSVAGVGDMNGDGLDDIALGAPRACNTPCGGEGAAFVVWGKPSSSAVEVSVPGDWGFRIYGPDANPFPRDTGKMVTAAGDLNADSVPDLLVDAGYGGSSMFVVDGKATTDPVFLTSPGGAGYEVRGIGGCCYLSLAGEGDLNADGRLDFLIGAGQFDFAGRENAGAIFAVLGPQTGPVDVSTSPGVLMFGGAEPFGGTSSFGNGLVSTELMDVDGNGRADMVAAFANESPNGYVRIALAPFVGGPAAALSLTPSAAENPVETEHCVTATVRDADGIAPPPTPVRFSATGDPVGNAAAGSDTTDADGQARFCYTGPALGPSVDSISAFADSDGDTAKDPDEPAGSANKTWVPTRVTADCRVHANGRIRTQSGTSARFNVKARASAGQSSGDITYIDTGTNRIRLGEVSAVVCDPSTTTAAVFGRTTRGDALFRVDLVDDKRRDRVRFRLSPSYDSGDRLVEAGEVRITKRRT